MIRYDIIMIDLSRFMLAYSALLLGFLLAIQVLRIIVIICRYHHYHVYYHLFFVVDFISVFSRQRGCQVTNECPLLLRYQLTDRYVSLQTNVKFRSLTITNTCRR